MKSHIAAGLFLLLAACPGRALRAQAIEFESNGLRFQTLTREGFTIMFAPLPVTLRDYVVLQVAASNGAPSTRSIKPDDFRFIRDDGTIFQAVPAAYVVQQFLDHGGRSDVIKLVGAYELSLYGLSRFKSTNGYEQRRQDALGEMGSSKLKAAAAASAIVFVTTKLKPGESTDGAIFFRMVGHTLGTGKLIARLGMEEFEFEVGGLRHPGQLERRP